MYTSVPLCKAKIQYLFISKINRYWGVARQNQAKTVLRRRRYSLFLYRHRLLHTAVDCWVLWSHTRGEYWRQVFGLIRSEAEHYRRGAHQPRRWLDYRLLSFGLFREPIGWNLSGRTYECWFGIWHWTGNRTVFHSWANVANVGPAVSQHTVSNVTLYWPAPWWMTEYWCQSRGISAPNRIIWYH